MILVLFIVANTADHAVLNTLGLDANQTESLSCMILPFFALWVFKGLAIGTHCYNFDKFLYKISQISFSKIGLLSLLHPLIIEDLINGWPIFWSFI